MQRLYQAPTDVEKYRIKRKKARRVQHTHDEADEYQRRIHNPYRRQTLRVRMQDLIPQGLRLYTDNSSQLMQRLTTDLTMWIRRPRTWISFNRRTLSASAPLEIGMLNPGISFARSFSTCNTGEHHSVSRDTQHVDVPTTILPVRQRHRLSIRASYSIYLLDQDLDITEQHRI